MLCFQDLNFDNIVPNNYIDKMYKVYKGMNNKIYIYLKLNIWTYDNHHSKKPRTKTSIDLQRMEKKVMTFDHDFSYFILLFSFLFSPLDQCANHYYALHCSHSTCTPTHWCRTQLNDPLEDNSDSDYTSEPPPASQQKNCFYKHNNAIWEDWRFSVSPLYIHSHPH